MSNTTEYISLEQTLCNRCEADAAICDNTLEYYLTGSILTICGTVFVICTYMSNATLREHPAVLIAARSIVDCVHGFIFLFQYVVGGVAMACNETYCDYLGPLTMFCILCSQVRTLLFPNFHLNSN